MQNDPRRAAIRRLSGVDGPSWDAILSRIADDKDKALATELVRGVLKWRGLLDEHLEVFSHRPLDHLRDLLRNALRVGAYQLLFTYQPDYACVDSCVSGLRQPKQRGYANAVLREMARLAGHVEMPCLSTEPDAYASQRYSYPLWIAALFIQRFGVPQALRFLSTGNLPPPLTIRVNSGKTDEVRLMKDLQAAGVAAREGISKGSIVVERGGSVSRLPGYKEGQFFVQDEGASAVARALSVGPGDIVWDVCAAPGGKTIHLSIASSGRAKICATDIDEERAAMVTDNVERLGLSNVTVLTMDATRQAPPGLFSKVLVDAPCSGLGVLRRNPDLRWNRRPSDVVKMVSRQNHLLKAASDRLRPGGILVYSTCTLTPEENEEVFNRFLSENPGFVPEDPLKADLEDPHASRRLYQGPPYAGDGWRYILPSADNDGFFVARAVKMT